MKDLVGLVLLIFAATAGQLFAQAAVSPAQSFAAAKTEKSPAAQKDKSPPNNLFAPQTTGGEPTTTEIYANEAFFDSNKNMGIFSGSVKVIDPRFNLQSDKLTVFISKGEKQGLEKAIAEGNVGLVRDRPDPNGGPPTRAVGRSEKATYVAATGDVELVGTPRVQEGMNIHVATSPDTIMVINQNGQLKTHGPSRTDIRQQPNEEKNEQENASPSASPSPTPKP
jgi:lipopolysaccharide transport protein LptA